SASFFVRQLLGMNEGPHRAVVDLQAALAQLGDQPPQRERLLPAAPDQPVAMLTRDLPRPVAPHLARRHTAGLTETANPFDHRAHPDAEPPSNLTPRQTITFDSSN